MDLIWFPFQIVSGFHLRLTEVFLSQSFHKVTSEAKRIKLAISINAKEQIVETSTLLTSGDQEE
jgi:hypothetical protein